MSKVGVHQALMYKDKDLIIVDTQRRMWFGAANVYNKPIAEPLAWVWSQVQLPDEPSKEAL